MAGGMVARGTNAAPPPVKFAVDLRPSLLKSCRPFTWAEGVISTPLAHSVRVDTLTPSTLRTREAKKWPAQAGHFYGC